MKLAKLAIFTATLMPVSIASAHVGHVGELAGHSHWIGIGAVVVAGAIAALAGKFRQGEQEDASEAEVDQSEETA